MREMERCNDRRRGTAGAPSDWVAGVAACRAGTGLRRGVLFFYIVVGLEPVASLADSLGRSARRVSRTKLATTSVFNAHHNEQPRGKSPSKPPTATNPFSLSDLHPLSKFFLSFAMGGLAILLASRQFPNWSKLLQHSPIETRSMFLL